jgi:hypothetical protein
VTKPWLTPNIGLEENNVRRRQSRGADRAAVMATLIVTAKLNDVDPQAWLADVPA